MSARLREVELRRRLLVAQADEQRGQLAAQSASLQQSLSYADFALRAYRRIRSSPVVIAVAAAALLAVGPGKLLRGGYRTGLLLLGLLRLAKVVRTMR
ncbi:MAG: YqjK family protein [Betaproteobacteria bacterium]|jgi:hypothetical protein